MKNLILIRHAKSSWEIPMNDIDRPLSKRGIKDAHLVATEINYYLPKSYVIWSSVAKRTKETATIFSQNLNITFENIIFKNELYTFDTDKLALEIQQCSDKYNNLIIFGHNPAITDFITTFTTATIEKVPTCGVVIISFSTSEWKNITNGIVTKTIFPKELK